MHTSEKLHYHNVNPKLPISITLFVPSVKLIEPPVDINQTIGFDTETNLRRSE